MAQSSLYSNQLQNRNYLSPVGFKFILIKYPQVAFFCNSVTLPNIILPTIVQPSYLKDINVPGSKVEYGDLSIKFLVDEDMINYSLIHNWITGLGFPESTSEFKNFVTNDNGLEDNLLQFSDGEIQVLDSNYQPNIFVKFKDLYPISLTPLEFTANTSDIQYFTTQVTFKYTIYKILDKHGNVL